MLFLTNNDSKMFQSCQHVFLGVQDFLCRFPDISMRFFREHSEMFWRANDNLPLIPSYMEGVVKFTARKQLWVVRKREELVVRRAFLQRRSDKRKEQAALLCVYMSCELHTSLKIWKNMAVGGRDMKNTVIDARVIQRSDVIRGTTTHIQEHTRREQWYFIILFYIHKQCFCIIYVKMDHCTLYFIIKRCKAFLNEVL